MRSHALRCFVAILGVLVMTAGCKGDGADQQSPPAMQPPMQSEGGTGGVDAFIQKKLDEAQRKVNEEPDNIEHLRSLGGLYFDVGRYIEASETYRKILEKNPNDLDAKVAKGRAYWKIGNGDQAVKAFRETLGADPDHADALYNLGMLLLHDRQNMQEAVQYWGHLVEVAPQHPKAKKVARALDRMKAMGSGAAGGPQR